MRTSVTTAIKRLCRLPGALARQGAPLQPPSKPPKASVDSGKSATPVTRKLPDVRPYEVIIYQGRVHLTPSTEYGYGAMRLFGKTDLVSYLYEQLEVPPEDGVPSDVNLYTRITVEVFEDPDMKDWPNNNQPPR